MSGEPAWADGQLSVIVPAADWQAGNSSPTNESKSASLGISGPPATGQMRTAEVA